MAKVAKSNVVTVDNEARKKFERADDNVRLTVRIPRIVANCIEEMQEVTPASSATDVIKDALILYNGLIRERLNGNDLYMISPDGERTKYPIFVAR